MQKMKALRYLLVFLALTVAGGLVYGQVSTAEIVGRVTDSSGAVVPNARVTIEDLATHEKRTTQTSGSGDYVFPLLSNGRYSVRIEAGGFRTFSVPEIALAAGDRARISAELQVGDVTQTVEVQVAAPALQTESSAVQSVVDRQAVQDLPLNGRNFFYLVQIQPGVNPGPSSAISGGNRVDDRRQASTLSANGQSDLYNNNMLDGIDNNEAEQGFVGVRPSVDSIAEVRVLTNNYTAELGRAGGAVVNVITRSGGNALHGSAYEYFRNNIFDAKTFYLSPIFPKPKLRQNQFGGSLGGPIIKNRTFFFGAVEELRIITIDQGQPYIRTVPTLFQQQNPGNFSDMGGPVIPPSSLDPIAKAYFKLYPAPNQPASLGSANSCGTGCTQIANNYQSAAPKTQFGTTMDVRLDHRFTDNDTFFGRYSFNPVTTTIGGAFPAVNVNGVNIEPGGGDGNAGPSRTFAQGIHLNYVHIFTPNLLLETKGAFTRIFIRSLPQNFGLNPAKALGLPNANVDDSSSALPVMSIQNYAALGVGSYIPILDANNIFQGNAAVSYTSRAHSLKFGAALIRRQLNYFQPQGSPQGSFTFNNSASGFALPYSFSMANFLVGRMITQTRYNTLLHPGYRTWEPSFYAQDNWRATSWLTLNFGLRYEIFTPYSEVNGLFANFDPPTLTIKTTKNLGVSTYYKDISPRVGFAATIAKNTVFSGGFGMSYYRNEQQSDIQIPNPPYYYSYSCSTNCLPSGATISNFPLPLPGPTGINSGCPTTAPCLTITWKVPDFHASRLEHVNAQLQRQLGANVLTVGYVGVLGRDLLYETNYNQPMPPGANNPTPPLRFATQLPLVQAIVWDTNFGYSNYHSLQAHFQRRFQAGLTINANYAWAHGLSNSPSGPTGRTNPLVVNDPSYDYGNSAYDIRHRIVFSANYQLPFGKSAHGAAGVMMKGWQVNTLAYWQSGQPFSVTNGNAQIRLPGQTTDLPDMVSNPKLANPTIAKWFDTTAFKPQTPGTAGSERRNQLYGPPDRRIDLSLFKNFMVREGWTLQFRAESFNITNTPNFATPSANLTSATLGQITATAQNETPRQFQFALKLLF